MDLRQEVRKSTMEKQVRAKAKSARLQLRGKLRRGTRAKRPAAKQLPARKRSAPDPPAPPQPPPEPLLAQPALALEDQADEDPREPLQAPPLANAAQEPRAAPGARLSHTPDVVYSIAPAGAKINIDMYALRWKGKWNQFVCSKGWYSTGFARAGALEFCLQALWSASGKERPADAYIECTEHSLWQGCIDDDPMERPSKRNRV